MDPGPTRLRQHSTGPLSLRPSVFAGAGAALLLFAAGGCDYVSTDGPGRTAIQDGATATLTQPGPAIGFVVVDLNPAVIQAANAYTQNITPHFARVGSGASSRQGYIGVGDIINITIFEASAGGLFIPPEGAATRGGNFVPIPPQQVETSGTITVPYAGQIRAAGRTPQQVSKEISNRLRQRAVEPEVVVSIGDRRSGNVSVLGDVNTPTRVTIDPGGLRVLDALARAGGGRSAPYETMVTLKRGDQTTRAMLSAIVKLPEQNPYLSPGDTLIVSKEPKFYLVLGATPAPGSIGGTNNRRFTFENENMTLVEAAAKAGGLDANRADARSVFLYRMESRAVLEQLGVDVSGYGGNVIPTIYAANFERGDAFFLASGFAMRNQDVVFVGEAPSIALQRFTAALSGLTGNASAVAATRAY